MERRREVFLAIGLNPQHTTMMLGDTTHSNSRITGGSGIADCEWSTIPRMDTGDATTLTNVLAAYVGL